MRTFFGPISAPSIRHRYRLSRLLTALCLVLCALIVPVQASFAQAQVIAVRSFSVHPNDDGYAVDAHFEFELPPRIEDAVNRGVAVYFLTQFELRRPRWYWLDELITEQLQTWRLSYNALTRQYRVSSGSQNLSFATLPEAVAAISQVRQWHVFDRHHVRSDTAYQLGIRLRMDGDRLPKPLQIDVLTNKEWAFGSDWRRLRFVLESNSAR